MCHNNMQYSCPELFVPEFALPISTSSFLAVTSQQGSVATYDTWKSYALWFRGDWCHPCLSEPFWKLPHWHLLLFYLLHLCQTFLNRANYCYHKSYARLQRVFVVFCLVLVLLWSNEACMRNKQKYEGKNQPRRNHIASIGHVPHTFNSLVLQRLLTPLQPYRPLG